MIGGMTPWVPLHDDALTLRLTAAKRPRLGQHVAESALPRRVSRRTLTAPRKSCSAEFIQRTAP
jgi:hypothetical protein